MKKTKELKTKNNQFNRTESKMYLLGKVITFITTAIIFYILYSSNGYFPNITFIVLAVLFMFIISHIAGLYLEEYLHQRITGKNYQIFKVLIKETLITTAIYSFLALLLMRSTLDSLVTSFDIFIVGLISVISLIAYILAPSKSQSNIHTFTSRIGTIIVTLLFIQLWLYVAPYTLLIENIVFMIVFLFVFSIIKWIVNKIRIKNQNRYNWIKGSITVLTIVIAYVNLLFLPQFLWTKPIIEESISINDENLTNVDIHDMVISDDVVYMYTAHHSIDGITESNYISMSTLSGEKLGSVSFSSDYSRFFIFDNVARVVTKEDNITKQYHINEQYELVLDENFSCPDNEVQLELKVDYDLYFKTDQCNPVEDTKVEYINNENLILKNVYENTIMVSNDNILTSNNMPYDYYKYSNNELVSSQEGYLEVYTYSSLLGFESNIELTSDRLEFRGSNTVTLDDSKINRLFEHYTNTNIYEFYSDTDYYYLVTGAEELGVKYLTVYDKLGDLVSILGFDSQAFTIYEGNLYINETSNHDGASIHKIDVLNASQPAINQGYIDYDDWNTYISGIGMSPRYNDSYQSGMVYLAIIMTVLFVLPAIKIDYSVKTKI